MLQTSGGNKIATWTTSSILDNQWHNASATWDRDGNLTLYVDGIPRATADISDGNGVDYNTGFYTFIGMFNDGIDGTKPLTISHKLTGQVDDVRIFNYVLTPTQIKTIYNNGAVTYGPAAGSP